MTTNFYKLILGYHITTKHVGWRLIFIFRMIAIVSRCFVVHLPQWIPISAIYIISRTPIRLLT